MSGPEAAAALMTITGIWLTGQRQLAGWPVSLAAALLYLFVFADARLFADSALQLVFCAFLLMGWHNWRRVREQENFIPVRSLSMRDALRDLAIGAFFAIALGLVLKRWTTDAAPLTDATLTVFSIIGQLWTARRYVQCWLLWIVVDLAYVILFITRDLWLTAGLYAGLVGLAVAGWLNWHTAQKSGA